MPSEFTSANPSIPLRGAITPKRRSLRYLVGALAGGNLLATALRMAGSLVTARVVEPATLGLFGGLGLFLGYVPFLQLGILNGLNRELPYYIGKGDHERARALASAAQAWALLIGILVAAGALCVSVFELLHGRWMLAAGWATNAVSAWLMFYCQMYLEVTYRTSGDFVRLALANVLQNAAGLLLVFLVWWLNFYGLCLRGLLCGLLQLAFLYYWRPLRVLPAWNRAHLVHLLKIGAPIFGVGQLYAWWTTLDATFVFGYMGTEGMGLYALAIMASSTMQLLPGSLSQILYPRMAQQFGCGISIKGMLTSSLKPMVAATVALALLAATCWILMPPVVQLLVPRYAAGTEAAQWSLLSPVLLCLFPVNHVFNIVKRQGLYTVAIVCGMITYYLSLKWLAHTGMSLVIFPQAMIAGKVVFMVICFCMLVYLQRKEAKAMLPAQTSAKEGLPGRGTPREGSQDNVKS